MGVVLAGVHAVKHALRFGAQLDRVVATDPAAAVALLESLAPDLTGRLTAGPAAHAAGDPVPAAGVEDPAGPVVVERAAGVEDPAGLVGWKRAAEVGGQAGPVVVERVGAAETEALAGGRADLVALARRPVFATAPAAPAVLLDNPRHLGNLGAVVRVAAGFGARAVLSTGTVDPWHPTVVRAAAGLHYAVDVRRVTDLPDRVVAFDPAGADLRRATIPDDAVLAFGSERHGLSPEVRARADQLLAIPMRPGVSSYNLATSVSVALYAWTTRRPE